MSVNDVNFACHNKSDGRQVTADPKDDELFQLNSAEKHQTECQTACNKSIVDNHFSETPNGGYVQSHRIDTRHKRIPINERPKLKFC